MQMRTTGLKVNNESTLKKTKECKMPQKGNDYYEALKTYKTGTIHTMKIRKTLFIKINILKMNIEKLKIITTSL